MALALLVLAAYAALSVLPAFLITTLTSPYRQPEPGAATLSLHQDDDDDDDDGGGGGQTPQQVRMRALPCASLPCPCPSNIFASVTAASAFRRERNLTMLALQNLRYV